MSEELTDRESTHGKPWKRRVTLDDVRASYLAEREKKRAKRTDMEGDSRFWLCFMFVFLLLSVLPVFWALWKTAAWPSDPVEAASPFVFCLFVVVMAIPWVLASKRQSTVWFVIAFFTFILLWLPVVLLEWSVFLFELSGGFGLGI